MKPPPSTTAPLAAAAQSAAPNTRLHGRLLVVVRVGWAALILFNLGSFVWLLPGYFAHMQALCSGPPCAYGQISPDALQTFRQFGLTLSDYAVLRGALTVILAVLSFAVAGVIVWHKSDDWLGLLVALWLVLFGVATVTGTYSLGYNTLLEAHQFPAPFVNYQTRLCFFLVFSLFPTGRFVPRWSFWLALADALVEFSNNFLSAWPLNHGNLETSVALLIWCCTIGGLALTQVYRYRRVSTPLERQQTKWAVFGLTLFIGMVIVTLVPEVFNPALDSANSFYNALRTPLFFLLSLLLALSFAIAILRYRLWDIDAIINRALVYGLLSGILGALYAGLIIGLEGLVSLLGGTTAQNPLVLVISTLAIAALFQPVRHRIQSLIDRRFYRRKYDAEKTLAVFSATLRQEVDLNQLRQQLLAVVQDTMQPTSASLWLAQPEQQSAAPAAQLATPQRPPASVSDY